MHNRFDEAKAERIFAEKRKLLGRGLSYTEKILFLHEESGSSQERKTPGKDGIRLWPDRVAMQDATAQMAMLQFMQARQERTRVPATIHCDHLLRASEGSEADLKKALISNREIYDFLSSAASRFGIGFWGPGSGIIHSVLFENYAVPGGVMIGTDSHTPNAGGLGMLAMGVGGADAAEAMAGLPWETLYPIFVGVRLKGRLTGWASAKDVILEMLRRFTVKGGTNRIFEYFGEGAASLSATQKATITNMGAELGATTSVFVYDASMDEYLRNVGRSVDADQAKAVSHFLSQDEICFTHPEKVYDQVVEIDLGTIEPAHGGPFSPDRVTSVRAFRDLAVQEKWPLKVSTVLLGSCTNSSYADLCAAADILEQGGRHGLKAQVPFMLSPGSRQVYETIKRDGILDGILKAGAVLLAASCGPCIGQWDRRDFKEHLPNCLMTTFNRNFRGRNDANPETRAFLTSPVMAAVLALSGDVGFDPQSDSLTGADGASFKLKPPETPALPPGGMVLTKEGYVPPSKDGSAVEILIDPRSSRLQLLKPFDRWNGKDFLNLPILVKTKGKTTTDHISPGGKWLKYRGHLANISQNMLEGAVNAFTGEIGRGTNVITGGEHVRFSDLAAFYKEKAGGFVIIGDENYGEGSSREHAAMTPRFLGARVVCARSFARIHEANLKKQGILPLIFQEPSDYDAIEMEDRMDFTELSHLKSGSIVPCRVARKNGATFRLYLRHTLNEEQIEWFRAGSALNCTR